MADKIIYTEVEMAKALHIPKRKLAMLRNAGIIKAVKVNRSWIYQEKSVDEFFNRYAGVNLNNENVCKYQKRKKSARP